MKWYLDVIDDTGKCAILYWARLDGLGLSVHFSSRMTGAAGSEPQTQTSLSAVPAPRCKGNEIVWSHESLGVNGGWTTDFEPVRRTLLDAETGQIRWTLHAAAGAADVSLGKDCVIGRGYVESLEMTLAPWKMPIRELRWGRANLSGGVSVVWIDWIGAMPRRWCFQNGQEVSATRIDDAGVEWSDATETAQLNLRPVSTLRDGPLGPTLLSQIPGVARLPPAAFLSSRETKWLSNATGLLDGSAISGWAIHERVSFSGMVTP